PGNPLDSAYRLPPLAKWSTCLQAGVISSLLRGDPEHRVLRLPRAPGERSGQDRPARQGPADASRIAAEIGHRGRDRPAARIPGRHVPTAPRSTHRPYADLPLLRLLGRTLLDRPRSGSPCRGGRIGRQRARLQVRAGAGGADRRRGSGPARAASIEVRLETRPASGELAGSDAVADIGAIGIRSRTLKAS